MVRFPAGAGGRRSQPASSAASPIITVSLAPVFNGI